MRVLIATDDVSAAASIKVTLANANLTCDTTARGRDALQMAGAYDYDIILLDLTRPDLEDYEVLRRLRAACVPTPILILSDRADPDCKIKGLGFGADDFLTKPFAAGELVERIQAIVRRSKGPSERVIRTGKLVVNLDTRVATVDGRPLHLTGKEYGILELLSLRKGTTLTKEMFLNHLYGGMDEPALKIIDVFVCKLRKKLAQATGGNHYIETVWGRGHVLRDPAPGPAATPVVTLEGLGGRHDAADTSAARNAPLGELTRRRPKLHRRSVGSSTD
jgi:two-component system, cell cycle response regulator CtrA